MVLYSQLCWGKKSASKIAMYSPLAISNPCFNAPALKPDLLLRVMCFMSSPVACSSFTFKAVVLSDSSVESSNTCISSFSLGYSILAMLSSNRRITYISLYTGSWMVTTGISSGFSKSNTGHCAVFFLALR